MQEIYTQIDRGEALLLVVAVAVSVEKVRKMSFAIKFFLFALYPASSCFHNDDDDHYV